MTFRLEKAESHQSHGWKIHHWNAAINSVCFFPWYYPLVNSHIAMERSTMLFMGKSTISMAIFNSYVTNYQAGYISKFLWKKCHVLPEAKSALIFPVVYIHGMHGSAPQEQPSLSFEGSLKAGWPSLNHRRSAGQRARSEEMLDYSWPSFSKCNPWSKNCLL